MRLLGDGRRLFIADVRVEGGDQHQRMVQVMLDPLPDRFDADGAVAVKGMDDVGQQA